MSSDTLMITFPGKYGDLLWALPTIRALSRRLGKPLDLLLPSAFEDIGDLLRQQPYIGAVIGASHWRLQDTAPISPRVPPQELLDLMPGVTEFLHLGYRDWPRPDVVRHTLDTYRHSLNGYDGAVHAGLPTLKEEELALDEPWITLPDPATDEEEKDAQRGFTDTPWIAGFTDEYFELKFGLWRLLTNRKPFASNAVLDLRDLRQDFIWEEAAPLSISTGARWKAEGFHAGCHWLDGARWLARTQAFLGDCSAWHVLAAAMGVPVVLMEPQAMRHNPVFYPLPDRQVFLVKGNDGNPTWDARHVAEALTNTIQWSRVERKLP